VAVAEDDFDPSDEARMVSALVDPGGTAGGPIRVVSLYGPNGREVGSPFYDGKLRWFARLERWLRETRRPDEGLLLGGDLNIAPTDDDVWDPAAVHGGTHVSPPERAAFQALLDWGLVDAYRLRTPDPGRFTWWDYRAGNFHKNLGMRIDHLLVSGPVAARVVWAEIDREARKGPPIPSDHAPLVIDLDAPGRPFDADWAGALARIAARARPAAR
jgi:exodeoxyribonuclease-3